ncbi:MAG: hypothetical protein ABFD90_08950 [Phycisphaerales bacterium]
MCKAVGLSSDTSCSSFSYLGQNPGAWRLSSLRLKEAADVLRQTGWPDERKEHDLEVATADFRLGPVYMLLIGMALEAGLKAILVAQNPALIGEQRISRDITTHRLKVLWDRVRFPKSRATESVLDRLERFVVAFGRYPVSKAMHDMKSMTGASFHADPDFDEVARLWASLEEQTKEVMPELFTEQGSGESV